MSTSGLLGTKDKWTDVNWNILTRIVISSAWNYCDGFVVFGLQVHNLESGSNLGQIINSQSSHYVTYLNLTLPDLNVYQILMHLIYMEIRYVKFVLNSSWVSLVSKLGIGISFGVSLILCIWKRKNYLPKLYLHSSCVFNRLDSNSIYKKTYSAIRNSFIICSRNNIHILHLLHCIGKWFLPLKYLQTRSNIHSIQYCRPALRTGKANSLHFLTN
jgi:hypothetical protein